MTFSDCNMAFLWSWKRSDRHQIIQQATVGYIRWHLPEKTREPSLIFLEVAGWSEAATLGRGSRITTGPRSRRQNPPASVVRFRAGGFVGSMSYMRPSARDGEKIFTRHQDFAFWRNL